jgi:SpoVK/Ycf46/Vps4 family AAA+-type ATPase
MHGPPGTGKTLLARAAAADAHAKLFVINGPDVLSEYFGESELGLRGIFAAAAALAPSVSKLRKFSLS